MTPRLNSGSVRARLVVMSLITTFVALVAASVAMLSYDVESYRRTWIADVTTQADIVAVVSAAAISFNDHDAARQNLELLRVRPQIIAGAIYGTHGTLFANYARAGASDAPVFPARPGAIGYRIDGDRLLVYRPVLDHGDVVGTVYLCAQYRLHERLLSYATILAGVMLASLLLAALVASRLQRGITRPLETMTGVAREVMQRRDFSLRVPAIGGGEIATLVGAFNGMLAEVERRADALQAANRTLEYEMAERQGAERALLLADRRKDEFLATLAHELRNPLAPIRVGLDILRISGSEAPAGIKARAIMERQLRQMVRLVDDLLDVSRINTGKLSIRREPVELQAVVNDALEIVRPFIDQHGHALTVSVPPQALFVQGDATRLAQILSNLLNNAAKYTDKGGAIELLAQVDGGALRVHIRDNGVGIAPEMLNDIFGMFIQADSSLERTSAGLGVGLSLARRLAELHGGTIEAHSAGLRQGSEFVLSLPLLAAPAAPVEGPAAPRSAAGTYRILLADDNADFINSIAVLLRALGHQVHICYDGAQAQAEAEAFAPDFAFLDIGLPLLNGYDLARALRSMAALRDTTLVAVTGWGQQKDRQMAFDAGFEKHLVKPVSFDQIEAILRSRR